MEIKNKIMGVEKFLVLCESRSFLWSSFIQAFSGKFRSLENTQKSFKIRTDGFLKFNNSKVFKNTKNLWNFRKNASKIEKLYHSKIKISKKQFFVCRKSCLKNWKIWSRSFAGNQRKYECMNEFLSLIFWNISVGNFSSEFYVAFLCRLFWENMRFLNDFGFESFEASGGNFSGKCRFLIFRMHFDL